jgi:hypothetical protein
MSYNQSPPWPPPDGSHASLNPPSNARRAAEGVPFQREQVYFPSLWIPQGANIGTQLRRRPITIINQAAAVDVIQAIQFDIPTTVFCLTAGVIDTTGANLPVGLNPLDSFTCQFQHTNGDLYDTQPMLGGASLGTAERPALLGGPGWMQDRGTSVLLTVQPLRANLRIDICLWSIEMRGPANYSYPSTGR